MGVVVGDGEEEAGVDCHLSQKLLFIMLYHYLFIPGRTHRGRAQDLLDAANVLSGR